MKTTPPLRRKRLSVYALSRERVVTQTMIQETWLPSRCLAIDFVLFFMSVVTVSLERPYHGYVSQGSIKTLSNGVFCYHENVPREAPSGGYAGPSFQAARHNIYNLKFLFLE
jgi:hypothetical protein